MSYFLKDQNNYTEVKDMPDMVNKFAQDLSLRTQAFLIILKTLIEEMNRTSATNAELRATQYLIARIQSESQKGKSGLNLIKKGKTNQNQ